MGKLSKIAHGVWNWGIAPIVWPSSWKRARLSIIFYGAAVPYILHPLATVTLFPRAEDYFEKHGINPETVTMLCDDGPVYVRERNFLGKTHAIWDHGALWPWKIPTRYKELSNPRLMYANSYELGSALTVRSIFMSQPDNFDIKSFMSSLVPKDKIENMPVSDKEFFWWIAMHEIRHCDNDNKSPSQTQREIDADLHACIRHLNLYKNPEMAETLTYWRALNWHDDDHETCMALRAVLSQTSHPTPSLVTVKSEALAYMEQYCDASDERDDFIKNTEACRKALQNHRDEMSVPAAHRLELYILATEYFAPSSVGVTPKVSVKAAPQRAAPTTP